MPAEFWELMDTVAKVGLGAVVAGIASIIIVKLQHRQTVQEATIRRRLELIEEITAGVAEFSNSVVQFITLTDNIKNAIYREDSTVGNPPQEWTNEWNKLRNDLRGGKAMEKPEGLLYLVSPDLKLPQALFDLQRIAEDVLNYAGQDDLSHVNPPALMDKQDRFKAKTALLVAELGKVYRNPSL